jgi:hypothetical protein
MIKRKQARNLFDKYVNGQCTDREKELLENYLESYQNREIDFSGLREDEEIRDAVWEKIQSQIFPPKVFTLRPYFNFLKYAAVFVGLAIGGLIFWPKVGPAPENQAINTENAILLKSGMNGIKAIDINGNGVIKSKNGQAIASQNQGRISFEPNSAVTEIEYNEIIVPKGKTAELVLSDGSLVHLNAETTFKFPLNFIKGKGRTVFLQGEAYFEVTKDSLDPFSVVADEIQVTVLGTHFSVNSYSGTENYAVVAEGSVAVQEQRGKVKGHKVLRPGQLAAIVDKGIEVREVNLDDYFGWRHGVLVFHDEPFGQIIGKIERKYNVEIINHYVELEPIKFYGRFDSESITDLMDTFKESARFEYEYIDDKIIINQPKTKHME